MKNIKILSLSLLIIISLVSFTKAQNTAITDDAIYTPDSSAMLDVYSTNKGMLVPRLKTSYRLAISNPAKGLLVFDIDENNFYFYNGTTWINLSSGNANNVISYSATNKVFLTDVNNNLGIGTTTPTNKLEVKADASNGIDQAIFNVINTTGDTVFAVYPQGVRINVYDDPLVKASSRKGGFAVGGFSPAKGTLTHEYLRITPDSIRMYIEEGSITKAAGRKGGFAVGGFSPAKATTPTDYFNIFGANTADILNPSEARIFWYPKKEAFLTGRVLVESPDSVGTNSFASGYESKAIGNYSQALGYKTIAKGDYSTAIGKNSQSTATNSFAFGDGAKAKADDSYAFGSGAEATGIGSYAFGSYGRDSSGTPTAYITKASGLYSIAFGQGALSESINAMSIGTNSVASGENSISLGSSSDATGNFSSAFGVGANASGYRSMALGAYSYATGNYSISMGSNASASSTYDLAIGYKAKASGGYSMALGENAEAPGDFAVAIQRATATGVSSVAIGMNNESIGMFSLSMGAISKSIGDISIAIGYANKSYGTKSLATGSNTVSNGTYSSSFGYYTNAKAYNSAIFGQYNDTTGTATSWVSSDPLFIVANGTSTSARNNALTVLKNGNIGVDVEAPTHKLEVNGDVQIGTNGTTVTNIIKTTVNHGTASTIVAAGNLTKSYSVPNAAVGSTVFVSPSSFLTAGIIISYAYVSSAGIVTLKIHNSSTASVTIPTTINWSITVIE